MGMPKPHGCQTAVDARRAIAVIVDAVRGRFLRLLADHASDPSPNSRQTHPIAEAVCYDAAVQITGPEVEEGGKEAEQRRVGQLEEDSDNAWKNDGWCHGCGQIGLSWPLVGDDVLVEVMEVSQAEDERRADDNVLWSCLHICCESIKHDQGEK